MSQGDPRAWSPQRGQVALWQGYSLWHVAAVSPSTALAQCCAVLICIYTLMWPPSHTGRRGLETQRLHFQRFELFHAPAQKSPSIAPQQQLLPTGAKGSDQPDLVTFLSFSASHSAQFPCVQCHIPISMKILVTSEGFKISKTHFLLHIPAEITWKIIIWPYIHIYICIPSYYILNICLGVQETTLKCVQTELTNVSQRSQI